ncbi:MAG: GNAT family N-acetyltransferase [Bacteroidales bacterium]|nr:GNAT family N-acetyltransferase [Bacteroidales bacterium]
MIIRAIDLSEIHILKEFLFHAIFVHEDEQIPPKEIVNRPELACYYAEFVRDDDICFVAENDNQIVGAIWTRIFEESNKGYGFVDVHTPELSMSVIENCRNHGIGTNLLKKMLAELKERNYTQVSLSVDTANFAYNLYVKFGFAPVSYEGRSVTMILKL